MKTTPSPLPLQTPGGFSLGCNYWASHAGTAMWRDWRPDVIESDFAILAANGVQLLRVFPLWPDFQPITLLRGGGGCPVEMRFGEAPLPFDATGQAGVSAEMLARFNTFCALAERHGLQLLVGIVTGWMSGRLFVPPALEGLNPITDPLSLSWQIKYVRTLVENARHQPAIAAWDLGNECNCMGPAPSRAAACLWTASISNAIRAADPARPIVSGMHSLSAPVGNSGNVWFIDDQAEWTDILTTHPYPYWTRHTRNDAVDALRTTLHATAETRFYAGIGGKPCFAEEIGTMGPMVASDEVSARFARTNLFSLWANDCRGFLWWCAHDQTELAHAPYDWSGVESELGLLRIDGTPKPVLREMNAFRDFLRSLPFALLPPRRAEAVCILTKGQDDWAAAFGSFVLAKQAKLELEFRHIQQAIPEAPIYLLPSLAGPDCVPRRQWLELLARVRAGATLYLSLGDGIVPHFNEIAGVELLTRATANSPLSVTLAEDGAVLPLCGACDLVFSARGAEVLGTRGDNGSPAFWRHRLGLGQVIVFAAPIESSLTTAPGAFHPDAPAYWRVYAEIARARPVPRFLEMEAPALAVTEHPLSDGRTAVVVINHSATAQTVATRLAEGIGVNQIWRGTVRGETPSQPILEVPPHDALVFALAGDGAI
ncbi:MAG: hypothetical protein PHQ12_06240 [Chthoniobacteraceae bacterium]|nr:hypothetical protein [Chthoniobacteraceae bacterium]